MVVTRQPVGNAENHANDEAGDSRANACFAVAALLASGRQVLDEPKRLPPMPRHRPSIPGADIGTSDPRINGTWACGTSAACHGTVRIGSGGRFGRLDGDLLAELFQLRDQSTDVRVGRVSTDEEVGAEVGVGDSLVE